MPPPASLVSKLKVYLKTSISRLRMVQAKDTAIAKQQRRAMAGLLEQGKVESARIRVENIIRSDLLTELHEILELYCELLLARAGLLEQSTMDPGLEEAIRSIIYAAPRIEIKELQQARQVLVDKYGKEFALGCVDDRDGKVPDRVKGKLEVKPPKPELVESYLEAIAGAYSIPYGDSNTKPEDGTDDATNDDEGGGAGGQKEPPLIEEGLTTAELSTMTPPRDLSGRSPLSIAPASPSTERPDPRPKMPGQPKRIPSANKTPSAKKPEGEIPDVDDLERRFALLKKP